MSHDHDHHHGHSHAHSPHDPEIRVEAIERLLTERGLVDAERIERLISRYETDVGPMNGARVVARAWSDPEYRQRLLDTGDRELIEGNTWGDRFWGVCRGEGENKLGRILMRVRDELRAAEQGAPDSIAKERDTLR